MKIFSILTFLMISLLSFAQEKEQRGVLITHAEKSKSHLILEGYKVKVFTKDTNQYIGVLGIHNSKTIVVGEEHIKISDIEELRGNDRRRTVGGKITMLTGAGLLGAAVITFIVSGEITEISPIVIAKIVAGGAGVALIAGGAGAYADKRNYKSSKGWAFNISGGDTVEP